MALKQVTAAGEMFNTAHHFPYAWATENTRHEKANCVKKKREFTAFSDLFFHGLNEIKKFA